MHFCMSEKLRVRDLTQMQILCGDDIHTRLASPQAPEDAAIEVDIRQKTRRMCALRFLTHTGTVPDEWRGSWPYARASCCKTRGWRLPPPL